MQESLPTDPRVRSRKAQNTLTALLLVVIGGAIAVIGWESIDWREPPPPPPPKVLSLYDIQESIRQPLAVPAAEADLREDVEVVGVSAAGRYRAFVLAALIPVRAHVVNDLLGDSPLTVTYCDRNDCVRVFTGPPGQPLDLVVGGWDNREDGRGLVLRVGAAYYRQATGAPPNGTTATPFPYAAADFERTTWGRWRAAHPDTDVYVGPDPTTAPPNYPISIVTTVR
jgi:hypothetical protein